MRGVKNTHQRTSLTSAVKLPDFSAEVWQLLTRSLGARRVEIFTPAVHLAKWTRPSGRKNEWAKRNTRIQKKPLHPSRTKRLYYCN